MIIGKLLDDKEAGIQRRAHISLCKLSGRAPFVVPVISQQAGFMGYGLCARIPGVPVTLRKTAIVILQLK